MLIIPNKSSNGYNYNVFLSALYFVLKNQHVEANFVGEQGTWADRFLLVKGFQVRFKNGKFIINDISDNVVFETRTDDPINEARKYFLKIDLSE